MRGKPVQQGLGSERFVNGYSEILRPADAGIMRVFDHNGLRGFSASLQIWQGWKDSNLRMPESKSGALTNLATPLHRIIVVSNNQPINRYSEITNSAYFTKLQEDEFPNFCIF